MAVDKVADLRIGLEASAVKTASSGVRIFILATTLVLLAAFGWMAMSFRRSVNA